jgi:hypothetical protein
MQINIAIPVPLNVTIDQAKEIVQTYFLSIAKDNSSLISDVQENWNLYTNNFKLLAKGQTITGTVTVGHNTIMVTAQLPFMLGFFKNKIESIIYDGLTKALSAH